MECMEPIIEVYCDNDKSEKIFRKYFSNIQSAKKYSEHHRGGPIKWIIFGPHTCTSTNLEYMYYIKPITITVMDDNDGEI